MISMHNDGTHNFGYTCFMPREVTIEGLHVDDSKHPGNYEGMFLFSDPGGKPGVDAPFPYEIAERVTIRGLTTASGKRPRVSPCARIAQRVTVNWDAAASPGIRNGEPDG
jgi:hypothetical protein